MNEFRFRRNNRRAGFILLHTLWFLLLVALLLAVTLEVGRRTAERLTIEKQRIERELAEESAVNDVLFEILERGFKPTAERDYAFNGQHFKIAAVASHGLVDVNAGQADFLRQIARHSRIDPDRLLRLRRQQDSLNPGIADYATLVARLGLTDRQFSCLYPYVTLFSGRSSPLKHYMPPPVKTLLGRLPDENSSVINNDERFTMGDSVRIDVNPLPSPPDGYYLSVEIVLTGRMDTPFIIRSWQRLAQCRKDFD
ncbi:MAG: hypothetical protein ACU84J_02520 [Gammaproteobacteria bacterium]